MAHKGSAYPIDQRLRYLFLPNSFALRWPYAWPLGYNCTVGGWSGDGTGSLPTSFGGCILAGWTPGDRDIEYRATIGTVPSGTVEAGWQVQLHPNNHQFLYNPQVWVDEVEQIDAVATVSNLFSCPHLFWETLIGMNPGHVLQVFPDFDGVATPWP